MLYKEFNYTLCTTLSQGCYRLLVSKTRLSQWDNKGCEEVSFKNKVVTMRLQRLWRSCHMVVINLVNKDLVQPWPRPPTFDKFWSWWPHCKALLLGAQYAFWHDIGFATWSTLSKTLIPLTSGGLEHLKRQCYSEVIMTKTLKSLSIAGDLSCPFQFSTLYLAAPFYVQLGCFGSALRSTCI